MTGPVTAFFECCQIMHKRANCMVNHLETSWLNQHPWPTEIVMDKGREFALEVADLLETKCGMHCKIVTSRNLQANSMFDWCHQTLANMICTRQTREKRDLHWSWVWLVCCAGSMSESHELQSPKPGIRDSHLWITLSTDTPQCHGTSAHQSHCSLATKKVLQVRRATKHCY